MSQADKNLLTAAALVTVVLIIWGIEALRNARPALLLRLVLWAMFAAGVFVSLHLAHAQAHDAGQWGDSDAYVRDWYQSLMQPDNPNASCCGEADAYWADEIHVRDGKTYATVTDDRPDEPRRRPHVDVGSEFEIPNHKLKWDRSNPTGHGVLFISRGGYVYCFVQPFGA